MLISRTALKRIDKLPEHLSAACRNVLRELAAGAVVPARRLKGKLDPFSTIPIGRGHRLVYRETAETVQVVDVGPRRGLFGR